MMKYHLYDLMRLCSSYLITRGEKGILAQCPRLPEERKASVKATKTACDMLRGACLMVDVDMDRAITVYKAIRRHNRHMERRGQEWIHPYSNYSATGQQIIRYLSTWPTD